MNPLMKVTEQNETDRYLRWAEEALRDIRGRIEHCGGGPDELNRQINAILDNYWNCKTNASRSVE